MTQCFADVVLLGSIVLGFPSNLYIQKIEYVARRKDDSLGRVIWLL